MTTVITNTTRRAIMKAAWTIVRQDSRSIADAMRRAWAWMKAKLARTVNTSPVAKPTHAIAKKDTGANWAKPIPVHTSTGNKVVWSIGQSYGRSSGYGAWIGR